MVLTYRVGRHTGVGVLGSLTYRVGKHTGVGVLGGSYIQSRQAYRSRSTW